MSPPLLAVLALAGIWYLSRRGMPGGVLGGGAADPSLQGSGASAEDIRNLGGSIANEFEGGRGEVSQNLKRIVANWGPDSDRLVEACFPDWGRGVQAGTGLRHPWNPDVEPSGGCARPELVNGFIAGNIVFFWGGHTNPYAPLEIENSGGGYALFVSSTDQGFWTVIDYGRGAFVSNPQDLAFGWNSRRENPLTGGRFWGAAAFMAGMQGRSSGMERRFSTQILDNLVLPRLRPVTYWLPSPGSGVPTVAVEPTNDGVTMGPVRVAGGGE